MYVAVIFFQQRHYQASIQELISECFPSLQRINITYSHARSPLLHRKHIQFPISILFLQPTIHHQFLIILGPTRRHTGGAHTGQLVTV